MTDRKHCPFLRLLILLYVNKAKCNGGMMYSVVARICAIDYQAVACRNSLLLEENLSLACKAELKDPYNEQFQKISIPTPKRFIGNSSGEGGLKSQNF